MRGTCTVEFFQLSLFKLCQGARNNFMALRTVIQRYCLRHESINTVSTNSTRGKLISYELNTGFSYGVRTR
jgi:hypothetical protein